jgi:aspartate oxidase
MNSKTSQKSLESNAEYQRRRMMSQHERDLGARDDVARRIHEQNHREGKDTTFDSALRKATQIAERADKDRNR